MKRQNSMSFLLLGLILLIALGPTTVKGVSGGWILTSKEDFEAGTMDNVDVSTSPGDVKIASGGSVYRMGNPVINRTRGCCGTGGWTFISNVPGTSIPVSGLLVGYSYQTEDILASPVFKLKIFRDNGTHYVLVEERVSPTPRAGHNEVRLPTTPIRVVRGDLIGFFIDNIDVFEDEVLSGLTLQRSGDQSTSPISSWTKVPAVWSVEAYVITDAVGTLVSTVKDTGGLSAWSTVSWTADTPQGTLIVFNIRSSNDSTTWTQWSGNYTSSGSSISSPQGRYIQHKTLLIASSGNSTKTPTLHDVTISFDTTLPSPPPQTSFLETNLPWLILAAVVVGFGVAMVVTRPKGRA